MDKMEAGEIPPLIIDAARQYAGVASVYHALLKGEDTKGSRIGVGYDPEASGVATISVGIVSETGGYHPRLSVTGRFNTDDPNEVFAKQAESAGPIMGALIRFFVHGKEKDFRPEDAGLQGK